jgi:hypothetical protein
MAPAFAQSIRFAGNTYAFKAKILRLGGRWTPSVKALVMPAATTREKRAEQRRLANEAREAGVAVHFDTTLLQANLEVLL